MFSFKRIEFFAERGIYFKIFGLNIYPSTFLLEIEFIGHLPGLQQAEEVLVDAPQNGIPNQDYFFPLQQVLGIFLAEYIRHLLLILQVVYTVPGGGGGAFGKFYKR